MPHFRKFHIKTVESLDVNDMSGDFVRLTWCLLPLKCCKEGRGMYLGPWLKSNLYPLREDVTSAMVMAAMAEFIEMGMIIVYQIGRREYFQIANWHDYQSTSKEAPSPYPEQEDAGGISQSGASQELVRSKSGVGKTNNVPDPSIYISPSKSKSKSSLKGGLGENGRYEGHIENTQPQNVTDAITEICNVVKGENALMPSEQLEAVAVAIADENMTGSIIGFRAWWDSNGHYNGRPALKSFINEWQNYIDGVDMTTKSKAQAKQDKSTSAIDAAYTDLKSKGLIRN